MEKLFLIEGKNLIDEARKQNLLKEVLTSNPNKRGIQVSKRIIKSLSSTKSPQDEIGICYIKETKITGNRILALDNIQDPGNLGTLIRTAKAFGWDGILLSGVDQYNDKVIRSSQGAILGIPILRTNDISKYFKGYDIYVAILNKKAKVYSKVNPKNKVMLVLGNEGNGLQKNIINKANEKIYIPIKFESLNIAQAGAILLNEYKKML